MNATLTFQATEHPDAHRALQHLEVSGHDCAILLGFRYFTAKQDQVDQIAGAGVQFAELVDHCGQIMTIPVN